MGDQSQGIVESKCLLYVNGGQEQGPGGNGAKSEVPQPPAKNKDYQLSGNRQIRVSEARIESQELRKSRNIRFLHGTTFGGWSCCSEARQELGGHKSSPVSSQRSAAQHNGMGAWRGE